MVVDATGLRVYGSGEGHVESIDMVGAEPGVSCTWVSMRGRKRWWRWRLHRAGSTTVVLLPARLDQIPGRLVQVSGDGAYDTRACYQSILEREAVATPSLRDAVHG